MGLPAQDQCCGLARLDSGLNISLKRFLPVGTQRANVRNEDVEGIKCLDPFRKGRTIRNVDGFRLDFSGQISDPGKYFLNLHPASSTDRYPTTLGRECVNYLGAYARGTSSDDRMQASELKVHLITLTPNGLVQLMPGRICVYFERRAMRHRETSDQDHRPDNA